MPHDSLVLLSINDFFGREIYPAEVVRSVMSKVTVVAWWRSGSIVISVRAPTKTELTAFMFIARRRARAKELHMPEIMMGKDLLLGFQSILS
jgi:hypothetical protein